MHISAARLPAGLGATHHSAQGCVTRAPGESDSVSEQRDRPRPYTRRVSQDSYYLGGAQIAIIRLFELLSGALYLAGVKVQAFMYRTVISVFA